MALLDTLERELETAAGGSAMDSKCAITILALAAISDEGAGVSGGRWAMLENKTLQAGMIRNGERRGGREARRER